WRTSTREPAPSPGSINAPTRGPTADIGFSGSAGTGSTGLVARRGREWAGARLAQQLGGFGPELTQLGVPGSLLPGPAHRLVDPPAGLVLLAVLPAREGLEEPVGGVRAFSQRHRFFARSH